MIPHPDPVGETPQVCPFPVVHVLADHIVQDAGPLPIAALIVKNLTYSDILPTLVHIASAGYRGLVRPRR